MMDPDIKAKWLVDLRSGKYPQAREKLHNYGAYCCLGVLCRTVGAEFGPYTIDDSDFYHTSKFAAAHDIRHFDDVPVLNGKVISHIDAEELSTAFLKRVSLTDEEQAELILMNDDGKSFIEIADYIENNL